MESPPALAATENGLEGAGKEGLQGYPSLSPSLWGPQNTDAQLEGRQPSWSSPVWPPHPFPTHPLTEFSEQPCQVGKVSSQLCDRHLRHSRLALAAMPQLGCQQLSVFSGTSGLRASGQGTTYRPVSFLRVPFLSSLSTPPQLASVTLPLPCPQSL